MRLWSFPPQKAQHRSWTSHSHPIRIGSNRRLWSGMDVRAAAMVGGWCHLHKGTDGPWVLAAVCAGGQRSGGGCCAGPTVLCQTVAEGPTLIWGPVTNVELLKLPTRCLPATGSSNRLFQCTWLGLTTSRCPLSNPSPPPKKCNLSFKD